MLHGKLIFRRSLINNTTFEKLKKITNFVLTFVYFNFKTSILENFITEIKLVVTNSQGVDILTITDDEDRRR